MSMVEIALAFVFGTLTGWTLGMRFARNGFGQVSVLLATVQGEKRELLDRLQSCLYPGSLAQISELRSAPADDRRGVEAVRSALSTMYTPEDY